MASLQVIKREAIPGTIIGGTGELRDFRWSDALCEFMPAASRLSMRWLRLPANGTLEARVHPAQTLLMVCTGSARVLGDMSGAVVEGDMLIVPAGSACGLAAGSEGVTVVSLQLGRGVADGDVPAADRGGTPSLEGLLAYSRERLQAFERCRIFALLDGGGLGDARQREALLNAFTVWSSAAEGLLFGARPAGIDRVQRSTTALGVRESWRPAPRDSIIEAIANWFAYQTYVLDGVERAAIAHLVVDPARAVCEGHASLVFGGTSAAAPAQPSGAVGLLGDQSPRIIARLEIVLREAWDMLDAMAERVFELAQVKRFSSTAGESQT